MSPFANQRNNVVLAGVVIPVARLMGGTMDTIGDEVLVIPIGSVMHGGRLIYNQMRQFRRSLSGTVMIAVGAG